MGRRGERDDRTLERVTHVSGLLSSPVEAGTEMERRREGALGEILLLSLSPTLKRLLRRREAGSRDGIHACVLASPSLSPSESSVRKRGEREMRDEGSRVTHV